MRAARVGLIGAVLALAACGKPTDNAQSSQSATPGATEVAAPVEPTAAMGEQIFKRCVACHAIAADGANGIGPNLHGVVGRTVASHPGFAYSSAMKAKGGTWDAATLDTYLEQPMMAVPGTKMAFAGIPDAVDRKAVILYLTEQSK